MTATLNLNEAKANFSSVLAHVHDFGQTMTILRYGHPIAQIVPIRKHKRTTTDPLISKVVVRGDILADDSEDWDNA